MASIYLVSGFNGSGDGVDPWRPAGFHGSNWITLAIDPKQWGSIVVSTDDTRGRPVDPISGQGAILLLSAPNLTALRSSVTRAFAPPHRQAISDWLARHGYQPLSGNERTILDLIRAAAHQINPAADITKVSVT